MSAKDFIRLAQSLSPALFRLPLLGDLRSLDAYGRATSIAYVTNQPKWLRGKKGFEFCPGSKWNTACGGISVPDGGVAAELQGTAFTLVALSRRFGPFEAAPAAPYIIAKRDAGGSNYGILFLSAGASIGLTNGVGVSTMTSSAIVGARSIAVRFSSGVAPSLFVNGIFKATGDTALVITANDADLVLGNVNINPGAVYNYGSPFFGYQGFLIFNDALLGRAITDQEISELHDAWESIV